MITGCVGGVLLVALTVATTFASASSAGPSVKWIANATSFEAAQSAIAVSPDGKRFIFGGNEFIAAGDVASGTWLWNESYVDIQAQIQGPYFFADNKRFAGVAPNSGTIATLWGVDTSNGNITWNVFDDASLDQQIFTAGDGAFYAACVTSMALVKVWGANGTKAWTKNLGDFVFGMQFMPGRHAVLVAYGTVASAYAADSGRILWNHTGLPTQIQGVAFDAATQTAIFVGSADPNGNALTYSTLYAFHGVTGKPLWSKNFTTLNATMVAAYGVVVTTDSVSAQSSTAIAVDVKTGNVLWKATTPPAPSNVLPAISAGGRKGTFILSKTLSDVTSVNATTGATIATLQLPSAVGTVAAAPIAASASLTIVATQTSTDGLVYAVACQGL